MANLRENGMLPAIRSDWRDLARELLSILSVGFPLRTPSSWVLMRLRRTREA
jgi:hypothetical protein